MIEFDDKKYNRILIVAPHPDDETLGCGGLINVCPDKIDILVLTDGCKGYTGKVRIEENDVIAIRKKEFQEFVNLAKIRNCFFLDIKDTTVAKNAALIKGFRIKDYDAVFVPNRDDNHVDHKPIYFIFKEMMKKQDSKCDLFEYEVWIPLRRVSHYITSPLLVDNKTKFLSCYKSQLEEHNYINMAKGLAFYRGALIDKNTAETYYLSENAGFWEKILNKIRKWKTLCTII